MSNCILIKNVRVIDPTQSRDGVGDILVLDGVIRSVTGDCPAADYPDARLIDGEGLCAAPGFIDMHVHFRDPGQTHKETLATGAAAAAAGGFTTVLCMPNTSPPCDNPRILADILARSRELPVRLLQAACLTQGMAGERLCDFAALKEAGAAALSDDGRPVARASLMREALEAAWRAGLPVVSHCEDLELVDGGIIHKGRVSEELGIRGMDRRSEDTVTRRECELAAVTGAPVHICHVSTAGAAAAVREFKAAGAPVTCETAPHYLLLTHEELRRRDANFRMNPPLREEEDRRALLEAVADGTIDAIITDHAPHTAAEKAAFLTAPNGVVGLETSFAACVTALVDTGVITLYRLVELMTTGPARILGLESGTLRPGAAADITLFDPGECWQVQPERFASMGRNTPFGGKIFRGRVKYTILGGRVSYQDEY